MWCARYKRCTVSCITDQGKPLSDPLQESGTIRLFQVRSGVKRDIRMYSDSHTLRHGQEKRERETECKRDCRLDTRSTAVERHVDEATRGSSRKLDPRECCVTQLSLGSYTSEQNCLGVGERDGKESRWSRADRRIPLRNGFAKHREISMLYTSLIGPRMTNAHAHDCLLRPTKLILMAINHAKRSTIGYGLEALFATRTIR